MKNHRSSAQNANLTNACGWSFAIGLFVLAALALYQLLLLLQVHMQEELVATNTVSFLP